MNERHSDFALLREFVREGRQPAFAALVREHLDLVYGTALRKVEDCGAAEEISQNVFSALARKAWQFASDDSVPAWLHKTTLLESKFWLRGELRRRRREETAAELGTTMNPPEDHSAFQALVPLLDDALLSLREKDRTALLLRYYEGQSLREVGAVFGVNEKVAQKRVQSALEKLAEFFRRRGFKTATVAATAAALQHTATSASATVVSTIVGAALKLSPPTLVGFTALVGRLASLSRVRTAAACATLAIVPLVWQLNQRHAAAAEVKRNRALLVAAQNNYANVQGEIDRLRQVSERLQQSVAQANETAARVAESGQAFGAWKRRIRGLLTAADYRWDDDSPFARIPKAVLPKLSELSQAEPFSPPGVVLPYARELMGLTASERESVEQALRRSFAEVESKLGAGILETNVTSPGRIPNTALAARVFIVPGLLEEEAQQRGDKMLAEVGGILGEERWPLVEARLLERRGGIKYSGGLRSILSQSDQDLALWVETDDKGTPTMGYGLSGRVATTGKRPLAMFLPEGDPNRIEGVEDFCPGLLSKPIRERAVAWLRQQATARLGKEARR
jgi:RNA polymerase sigma factor (sigma-70 family)